MSLKISYFNARGYTEPIRWILAHAGIEFEDVRVPLETLPPVVPPEIKASKIFVYSIKLPFLLLFDDRCWESEICC